MVVATGLDWTVEQHPLEAVVPREYQTSDPRAHHVANVRSDKGAVLGVVGEGLRAAAEPAGVRVLRRDHGLRAGAPTDA
jgi:hypothetical protein